MKPRKLTKEDIDKVRDIEGFPIGTDEDIIALSDAPYYTACPNPFIEEFIRENGTPYDEETDDYHCEPFAADVSEGKKDPIYNAHSYHTKVPYKAIMKYILHYTKPGDLVFDGFCGTGMTAVAAQMCGKHDPEMSFAMTGEFLSPNWGERKAIISDLSPAATFISSIYTKPIDVRKFRAAFNTVFKTAYDECGWMYKTRDSEGNEAHINYVVWSDVFICPNCGEEIVFWDVAVDKETGGVKDEFLCTHCRAELTKKACSHAFTKEFDPYINEIVECTIQRPVLIAYEGAKGEITKVPDVYDLELIEKIESIKIPYSVPTDRMPIGGESRRNDKYGITHSHHFFTKRNLYTLSTLWNAISNCGEDTDIVNALKSVITGVMQGVTIGFFMSESIV